MNLQQGYMHYSKKMGRGSGEGGHWYARTMTSYGLLQAMTGTRYDAVEQVLYLSPQVDGDFRAFIATNSGFGTVGIADDEPFVEVVSGEIPIKRIDLG